jgi:hypothetical protein
MMQISPLRARWDCFRFREDKFRGFDIDLHVKVELSLCFLLTEHHAMKAYWGSEVIAPLIL